MRNRRWNEKEEMEPKLGLDKAEEILRNVLHRLRIVRKYFSGAQKRISEYEVKMPEF